MTFASQIRVVVRSEAQIEARAGDVLWVAAPFGLAALLVLAVAVGADLPLLRQLGAGVYWTMLLVIGALVALRAGTTEPAVRREALLLAGLDDSARFVGRWVVASGTMLGFGLLLWPVLVIVYGVGAAVATTVLGLLPLVAGGLGGLGTLAGELTAGTGARALLVSLLVVPLGVPLVVAGTQAAEGVVYGTSPLPWVALALTVDMVVLVAGLLAAPALVTAPRSIDTNRWSGR